MKVSSTVSALALALGTLFATSSAALANEKLSVAATPVPAAEVLEFMKPQLAEYKMQFKVTPLYV